MQATARAEEIVDKPLETEIPECPTSPLETAPTPIQETPELKEIEDVLIEEQEVVIRIVFHFKSQPISFTINFRVLT